MSYFPDLSPYSYISSPSDATKALNIGWLDSAHEYPKGHLSEELQHALLRLCFKAVNQTRGFHPCDLCIGNGPGLPKGIPVEYEGQQRRLGSAEIRVVGETGQIYAAPTLILHYVRDHAYLPPEEFLEALRHTSG